MEIFGTYTGPDFLALYGILLTTCVIAGLWIPANLRPEGRRAGIEDMEEVAILAGGFERHAMAVSSDLMARDALTPGSKKRLRVSNAAVDTGLAGRAVLNEIGDLKLSHLKLATLFEGKKIEADLQRRGLLMDEGDQWKLRWLSVSPYLALIALGLYRFFAGRAEGEATGFLLVMLIVTAVFAVVRFARLNKRTKAGNEVLRDLEQKASRLRRAPVANEAGFAVALFGTAVLVGTPWEQVHAMRNAGAGGGDGGVGGDDGGDGGGGCGGGCGGCGG